MPDITPIVRALEAELATSPEVIILPAALLRALLKDYRDAADCRARLHGYQQRLSEMVSTVTAWTEVDG